MVNNPGSDCTRRREFREFDEDDRLIGIGGGVESMSMFSMQGMIDPETISDAAFEHPEAQLCMMSMGITSENVAEKYGITREQMDKMAVESHRKAAHA